jgi:glycosyltransferase involved in cell wall biosynthesis
MNVLVSVITASYNKSQYISDTVHSVLNQTYSNLELIIIDDASTDSTITILKSLKEKDNRIQFYINSENKGANYCRNIALQKSSGKYVIFIDADDLLSETCIESRVLEMENRPSFHAAIFSMGVFDTKIGDLSSVWFPQRKDPLSSILSHDIPWSIMQPIWNRDFLLYMKGFDETFNRLQDVEFHTRVLFEDNFKFVCFNKEPDCFYRIDNKRSVDQPFRFLKKIVSSGIAYYNKFSQKALQRNLQRKLVGTIYKIYLRLLHEKKSQRISLSQFTELENELLYSLDFPLNRKVKVFFKITRFLNLLPLRIKGLNYLISKFLY